MRLWPLPTASWLSIVLALGLGSSWLWLHRASLAWIAKIAFLEEYRLNFVLFLLLGGLVFKRLRSAFQTTSLQNPFSPTSSPLPWTARLPSAALFSLGIGLWLTARLGLRSNLLAALSFGFGSYGLLGLLLPPRIWRQGLPAALMLFALLPFGTHLDIFFGFPLRVWTAQVVGGTLRLFGLASISAQDVILLENGLAHVDLPCSGVKSLWSGSLFFFAATWLEARMIGLRWLFLALLFFATLVAVNLCRVFLLTLFGFVFQQPDLAHALHLPLGILGFLLASSLAYLGLHLLPRFPPPPSDVATNPDLPGVKGRSASCGWSGGQPPPNAVSRPTSWLWSLGGIAAFVGLGHLSEPASGSLPLRKIPEPPVISLPAAWKTTSLPLTWIERSFFASGGAHLAKKWRFQTPEGLRGSLLAVASLSWKAHHPPEVCYAGQGLRVGGLASFRFLDGRATARLVTLQNGLLTGVYWYQSPSTTTDDLLTRIWRDLTSRREPWFLVSLLFDSPITPTSATSQAFFSTLHQGLASSERSRSTPPARGGTTP